jgi:hypothetical protein
MNKKGAPRYQTPAELKKAIQHHQERAEKLLAEVRACRDGKSVAIQTATKKPAP